MNETILVQHVFPLRADLLIDVKLPNDLTSAEVERIERWLKTLVLEAPMDRMELAAPRRTP